MSTVKFDRNNTSFITQLHEWIKKLDPSEYGYLKYYQFIAAKVFSMCDYGARGLLLNIQTGGGKSHLAIHLAIEATRGTGGVTGGLAGGSDQPREVLLILPKSLEANMRGAIYKYIELRRAHEPEYFLALMPRADLDRWIDRNFSFVSLNASNMLGQLARATLDDVFGDVARLPSLDGKLLIVDEAHNLFRAIINGSKNAIGLYDLVMRAKNLRCLFLSGTPISNDVFEMVPCFNMLASNIPNNPILPESYKEFYTLYVDKPGRKMKNRGKLANRIVGLTSSFRFSNPPRDMPATDVEFPEQLPTIIRAVHMTPHQWVMYGLARDREKEEGGRGRAGDPPAMTKPRSRSSSTYRVRSRQISNFCPQEYSIEGGINGIPADYSSPKFEQMWEDMAAHAGTLGIIYSQFVGMGGLEALEGFLQSKGYRKYTIPAKMIRGALDEWSKSGAASVDPVAILEQIENSAGWYNGGDETEGNETIDDYRGGFSPVDEWDPTETSTDISEYVGGLDALNSDDVFNGGNSCNGSNGGKNGSGKNGGVKTVIEYADPETIRAELIAFDPTVSKFLDKSNIDIIVSRSAGVINGYAIVSDTALGSREVISARGVYDSMIESIINDRVGVFGGDPIVEATAAGVDVSRLNDAHRPSRQKTYCVISGDVLPEVRNELTKILNNVNNRHGEIIDLILTGSSGAEGLDLKRIRFEMMMEPYWTASREKQFFARGVRNDSHIDMPAEEKNVQPYVYLAIPPETERIGKSGDIFLDYILTTDMELYSESQSDYVLITDALEIVNSVSVECLFNGNIMGCRQCNPTNVPLFTTDPATDVRAADPCSSMRSADVAANEVTYEGKKYYWADDASSAFGVQVFEWDEAISAYRPMRESNPIFMELVEAIKS